MGEADSYREVKPSDLLNQLEFILESDSLINEVGFIHPSQFVALSAEAGTPLLSSLRTVLQPEDESIKLKLSETAPSNLVFWSRDHKLGISTEALLPLYNAAKHAFMDAVGRYKNCNLHVQKEESGEENVSSHSSCFHHITESEVMNHSRALLLLSCDFGTAWNIRKLIVSKEPHLTRLTDELLLSELVLSYSPKSERAWSHRRWVIKMIAGKGSNLKDIVEKESELVKKIAEKSKMNYRAWNHRCWLVSYMPIEQVLYELLSSRDWAGLHVADNSCFHYRTRLMLKMLEDSWSKQDSKACSAYNAEHEHYKVYKEELEWNEMLIKRYIGREALWLYRRFLSLYWIKHFAMNDLDASSQSDQKGKLTNGIDTFIDNELQLLRSCLSFSDNDFEDYETHAMFSATYILWITKQFSQYLGIELQRKLRPGELDEVLNKLCPENTFRWNSFKYCVERYNLP